MKDSISDQIKQAIFEAVKATYPDVNLKLEDIELEHPTVEDHGDYSTNIALKLAKQTGQNPKGLADKIIASLARSELACVGKVQMAGPGFINFWLAPEVLVREVGAVREQKEKYGSSETGAGKTVVIDYSAPNIAKRFGIGHLRSTIIGQAIYNLYKFSGYKTIGDNHLGDWGTQFGKLLYMIDSKKRADFTIDDLENWYVEFHKKAEQDRNLEEKGREWFVRLEKGDTIARDLWSKCVEVSMTEFNRIYELLNVKIDYAYGESFYEGLMGQVISEAKNKGIAKESDGAWVIEISGVKTPLLLLKSDGATTYATRDLATLKFRQKEWKPDIVIYEVGGEQALHFVQVFAAARMLGYVKESTVLVHTKHGLYRWEHGKMKTRKGDTIKLEEILTEAISRAKKLAKDASDEKTVRAVGIGAVKYFDLKHNVQSDIVFDWEKMFALEGDSGPYLQYTFARARSVLRKSKVKSQKSKLQFKIQNLEPEELAVLRYLYRFPEVVEAATGQYAPNLVCSYLFELAKRFNAFYNNVPILKFAEKESKFAEKGQANSSASFSTDSADFRLSLTAATAQVLKNGLNLLGIAVLEKM